MDNPFHYSVVTGNAHAFPRRRTIVQCLGILAWTAVSAGVVPGNDGHPKGPRIEDLSQGPVQVILTVDPPAVELDKDLFLTIRIATADDIEAALPSLDDRLQGFGPADTYDDEPIQEGGKRVRVRHARLTPLLAPEYRLAPMPIVYTRGKTGEAEPEWFATRPVVFEARALSQGKPDTDIRHAPKPVWIRPPLKTLTLALLPVLALVALAVAAWKLFSRIRREQRLRRMTPRERALKELAELLARDLVGRNLVKDFYVELTMVVRRYIERAHSIRAPEQTTEEFLASVSHNRQFLPDVVDRLRAFLEAADLVKFAAYRPATNTIGNAIDTARHYIESDADAADDRRTAAGPASDSPVEIASTKHRMR